jgi:hypothetical protein
MVGIQTILEAKITQTNFEIVVFKDECSRTICDYLNSFHLCKIMNERKQ